jgi:hypothetical protein
MATKFKNSVEIDGYLSISSGNWIQVPDGTTAQRPGSPQVGMFRYNTTTAEFEGYFGSPAAWGAIGGGGGGGGYSREINNFTISDSTTSSLTLTLSQPNKNYVDLFIDGVYQSKLLYSTTNNILNLNSGVFPNGSSVEAIIINGVLPPGQSITADSTTVTADSTTITADQT